MWWPVANYNPTRLGPIRQDRGWEGLGWVAIVYQGVDLESRLGFAQALSGAYMPLEGGSGRQSSPFDGREFDHSTASGFQFRCSVVVRQVLGRAGDGIGQPPGRQVAPADQVLQHRRFFAVG